MQDQVGSVGLIRSRQIRQESAPAREEVKKDWIFVRSGDELPEISMYDRKMVEERSA